MNDGPTILRPVAALAAIALLAACHADPEPQPERPGKTPPTVATPSAPAAAPFTDAWIGRWTGPEGLFLVIAPGAAPGRYALTIKGDLDSTGDRIDGIGEGSTIRFTRHGIAETLRAGDGNATGLKWLAGKRDCLVVKPGEGFCRD